MAQERDLLSVSRTYQLLKLIDGSAIELHDWYTSSGLFASSKAVDAAGKPAPPPDDAYAIIAAILFSHEDRQYDYDTDGALVGERIKPAEYEVWIAPIARPGVVVDAGGAKAEGTESYLFQGARCIHILAKNVIGAVEHWEFGPMRTEVSARLDAIRDSNRELLESQAEWVQSKINPKPAVPSPAAPAVVPPDPVALAIEQLPSALT